MNSPKFLSLEEADGFLQRCFGKLDSTEELPFSPAVLSSLYAAESKLPVHQSFGMDDDRFERYKRFRYLIEEYRQRASATII